MGKNSGYHSTNRQVQSDIDYSRQRSQEFDTFLRNLFGPQFESGNNMLDDAHGRYNEMYGRYGNFADTGGADEYSTAGRDFYKNLMNTGGFTPEQQQMFRRQATAPTRGFWDAFKRENEMAHAVNPFNPGGTASSSHAARKAAQNVTEAGIGAENALQSQIREGKLAGAAGTERMWGMTSANKLAGFGGQMQANAGMTDIGMAKVKTAMDLVDSMLANATLDANTRNQLLHLKAQMNPKVSGWDRAMQVAGVIANIGTSAAGFGLFGRRGGGGSPPGYVNYGAGGV